MRPLLLLLLLRLLLRLLIVARRLRQCLIKTHDTLLREKQPRQLELSSRQCEASTIVGV
jgi:hypothetical protein